MRAGPTLLLATLALTGCAIPVRTQIHVNALARAQVCCRSYADFSYEPLVMDQERTVELGARSPAFVFESGKSFFYAGRLPAYTGPLSITIDTYGSIGDASETAMLRPEVLLLDKDFTVQRRIAAEKFKRSSGANLTGSVFINEKNSDELYLVLYANSSPPAEGETVKRLSPTNLYLPGGVINVGGTEETVPLSASPGGAVKLTLQRYAPSSIHAPTATNGSTSQR